MDMGDILAQWDDMKKKEKSAAREKQHSQQVSHKKANAPKKSTSQQSINNQKINPMEYWLNRYGTVDKDKIAEQHVERTREQDRNYVLNMKPEAFLDLHKHYND